MTIFFFSHAHEQIERENKNKARKKDSFPHFILCLLALKSPHHEKQTLVPSSKKPKVMSNYPFLNNWKCFSEGERWLGNVCICTGYTTPGKNSMRKVML